MQRKSELLVHPEELSKKHIDRMADAGIDILGLHPVGGHFADGSLRNLVERLKTQEMRELLDYAHERGLEIEYECHAASYLLPRALFESHPEYFRMDAEGERTPQYNFCVSNEDALELYSDRAVELALSLYRSRPYFYFWMDDRRDAKCHCPACRPMSTSDQQLTVANRIIRKLRRVIPDAHFAYLAYFESVVTPEHVKPEEGVFLEYAPFEKYVAKGENAQMLIQREQDMLRPTAEFFGKKDFKVLEYWYDNSMYSGWKKPPKLFTLNRENMERDVRFYKEQGAASIASFACYLGEDYEALYGDESIDFAPFAKVMNEE